MRRSIQFRSVIILAGILLSCAVTGYSGPGDSTKINITSDNIPPSVKAEVYRTFEGLGAGNVKYTDVQDPIVIPNIVLADSVLEKRNYAHALLEKVSSANRFKDALSALSEIDLPIGIVKSGGAVDYSILIDRMTFTTKGALMEVYVSLALKTGERIAFNGKVPLSKDGGIAGTARIFLVGDHFLKLSEKSMLTLKGNKNTFVEFDCNGFVGIGVEGEIEFSRDLIVPENKDGKVPNDNSRVRVTVNTYAQSLNNMMVGVTIPAFQVKGMDGFGFTVTGAALDWSDTRNPDLLEFPAGYTSSFIEAGQPKLWQGFYLHHLEVRLPPAFGKKKEPGAPADTTNNKRITITADHMIIDDRGFSGLIAVAPVIELGDMSGWSYSIDKFGLEFVTNQVKGFEIAGRLTIPAIKSKEGKVTQFGYKAQRGADGNYLFAVSIENELKFPLFVADLKLFQGSSVVVQERNDKFYPTATLNGEITIKAAKAMFNSLRFEGLRISTDDPHFDIQAIGFGTEGSNQSMSKYPLVINNIMLKKDGKDRIGLGLDITINIGGGEKEGGFGGTAALIVWGKRDRENTTSEDGEVIDEKVGKWKFDKVELTGIGIKFKKAGVIEIEGMIRFFEDDPVYGDGFKGSISGTIQVIKLQVEVLFGKTPTYRYWFADAMVEFSSGLPLVSGFSAYGFGGGFYSKMKQSTKGGISSPLGMTASGVAYVPDENTFGIKALVKFGCTGSQMPYNGDVALEVELNRHGGINSVTFTGNLHVLTPPPIVQTAIAAAQMVASAIDSEEGQGILAGDPSQGAVSAHVKIFFDNVNHVFHANMEMYINVVGGIVKGIGENGRAGWAVMHFEKSDWYVLIGTPADPVGIELLWMIKLKSYFMLGKHLPGSPPPPKQVSEILGIDASDLDYMRNLNELESGLGFAFGMSISMNTGDISFLMFYGSFEAGIGTDFMLKQYGQQYHCVGEDGPIGINGWFANGQAYAYMRGKIGINVNLLFYKGKYEILRIGAAAVLQAKGPNPFWMRGIVGGYYSILGGLVKGKCKFEVTIGKECKIVGPSNPLADVKMIAEVSPAKNATEVDVFTAPQVAFNVPVNQEFEITDLEDRKHVYRAYLDEFVVLDGKTEILGSLEWNEEGDVVMFNSRDILPGEKKLTAKAKLTFEEKVNGAWTKVKFDGKIVEELDGTEFETGKEPTTIGNNNVSYSYPLNGQINFYPKEYGQGVIKLKRGQPKLFQLGEEWIQKIRMTKAGGNGYVETDLSYNESETKVLFTIPTGFENSTTYAFEILNMPRHSTVVDANVQKVETEVGADNNATLTTKEIEGDLANLEIKSIFESKFRTSKYNTFREKIFSIQLGEKFTEQPSTNVFLPVAKIDGAEAFDKAEMEGIMSTNPLIQFEANLDDNQWYTNLVYPLVYEGYPLFGSMKLTKRTNPEYLGIPPVRDVYVGNYSAKHFSDDLVASGPFGNEKIVYNLGESVYVDFRDLQNQAANFILKGYTASRLQNLVMSPVPIVSYGPYKLKLKYLIPGQSIPNTVIEWELFNRLKY